MPKKIEFKNDNQFTSFIIPLSGLTSSSDCNDSWITMNCLNGLLSVNLHTNILIVPFYGEMKYIIVK